ncbi:MAG: phosphate ABC transporter permease subunit PstC [candidate division WOR-3 bacterium]
MNLEKRRIILRLLKEKTTRRWMSTFTFLVCILFLLIFLSLLVESTLLLSKYSLKELLFSSKWNPEKYSFGFLPAIIGTIYVTILSMVLATPIAVLSAIYISEFASSQKRILISSFIDILAGIPSVVFGVCALLVLVPLVSNYIGPLIGVETTGMCIFTASLVLSVMVLPVIISLSTESLKSLPVELREASLSLGATKWETIKKVLLKGAAPGIFSAILLGFGRAFGETMAVAMVIGGKNQIPSSPFSAGQTLPSLIVSSFGEMMSIPIEQSALAFAALQLFFVVTIFNFLARWIKIKLKKRWGV